MSCASFRCSHSSDLLEKLLDHMNSSISQPRSTTTTTACSSEGVTTATSLSIQHQLLPTKSRYIGFKRCAHCRRFLMYFAVKRQDQVYACNVCGVRVHEGCVGELRTSCVLTSKYVGGLIHNAVIESNREKWESTRLVPRCSVSSPQSPTFFNSDTMTATTSTLDIYDDDLEKLMTWEDVTIRPADVEVRGRIGEGRFGAVHYAHYHGDAAIKFVDMDFVEPDRRVEVFKAEVVTAYKNSRHDHIVMFLGYVADETTNTYALVTNFYHHKTLYHRIHDSSEDFDTSWALTISLQICQAMSYLHKKKILHKDLRSKNILLDKANKAVVADFELLKLERLAEPRRNYTMTVPNHWLDYVAPEIAGSLFVDDDEICVYGELPFTGESDVYSFGTIFFELLMRKMPSGSLPWEVKLYEKMAGTKTALSRLDSQTQRIDTRLTDLLMRCWKFHPMSRPVFAAVVKSLHSLLRRKESMPRRSGAHENPYF